MGNSCAYESIHGLELNAEYIVSFIDGQSDIKTSICFIFREFQVDTGDIRWTKKGDIYSLKVCKICKNRITQQLNPLPKWLSISLV